MFRAMGFVIVLYAITLMMAEPFEAFKDAATATFETVEVAARISGLQLVQLSKQK